ncbi:GPI anchored serine-threonine rich protein [Aspergillus homomorphus CBS 101889]|uniref:GPI anchored serine-threonine rich protein n=1 Tax=Aspergillus homomorphus (strain CBS 101889) TaxID=1450537 RepID=A0A395HN33_ASPHC|nr:hypothetical protein BO97DRAFT_427608 [Aspergillus homomorphus CBS 101889]RAL09341.1 hypothetical protein BO97DRAFT_427608 [Aspergillus homomorphus CBS 101889]
MNLKFLPILLASASFVAASPSDATAAAAPAATTASTGDTAQCAKSILDACLKQLQPQMSACAQNDWDCLCTQSQNVLTCYNVCPSDPGHYSVTQQQVSYCNAAQANSLLYSTSTKVTRTSSSSATAVATKTTDGMKTTASATATGTAKESSGAAVAVGVPGLVGGLEVGVLGVMALGLGVWGL